MPAPNHPTASQEVARAEARLALATARDVHVAACMHGKIGDSGVAMAAVMAAADSMRAAGATAVEIEAAYSPFEAYGMLRDARRLEYGLQVELVLHLRNLVTWNQQDPLIRERLREAGAAIDTSDPRAAILDLTTPVQALQVAA